MTWEKKRARWLLEAKAEVEILRLLRSTGPVSIVEKRVARPRAARAVHPTRSANQRAEDAIARSKAGVARGRVVEVEYFTDRDRLTVAQFLERARCQRDGLR